MNTSTVTDESKVRLIENPGAQLARLREKRGFTQEYVAGKLHLRVKIISLLEADEYQNLPEPVFIKGYIRAYTKLLGVNPEPFLLTFNNQYASEKKPEKALWQSRRESNHGERLVRWFTALIAFVAIGGVSFWWQKNKGVEVASSEKIQSVANHNSAKSIIPLSQMQSLFSAEKVPTESQGG